MTAYTAPMVAKSISAGCLAAAGSLGTAMVAGELNAGAVAFIILTGLGTGAGAFVIPNAPVSGD